MFSKRVSNSSLVASRVTLEGLKERVERVSKEYQFKVKKRSLMLNWTFNTQAPERLGAVDPQLLTPDLESAINALALEDYARVCDLGHAQAQVYSYKDVPDAFQMLVTSLVTQAGFSEIDHGNLVISLVPHLGSMAKAPQPFHCDWLSMHETYSSLTSTTSYIAVVGGEIIHPEDTDVGRKAVPTEWLGIPNIKVVFSKFLNGSLNFQDTLHYLCEQVPELAAFIEPLEQGVLHKYPGTLIHRGAGSDEMPIAPRLAVVIDCFKDKNLRDRVMKGWSVISEEQLNKMLS